MRDWPPKTLMSRLHMRNRMPRAVRLQVEASRIGSTSTCTHGRAIARSRKHCASAAAWVARKCAPRQGDCGTHSGWPSKEGNHWMSVIRPWAASRISLHGVGDVLGRTSPRSSGRALLYNVGVVDRKSRRRGRTKSQKRRRAAPRCAGSVVAALDGPAGVEKPATRSKTSNALCRNATRPAKLSGPLHRMSRARPLSLQRLGYMRVASEAPGG